MGTDKIIFRTSEKLALKLFISSSSELKIERDKTILILFVLNKAFPHLALEPVLWEYDVPKKTTTKGNNLQNLFIAELKECKIAIFLFFSKIGKYTRQEFRYSQKNNIDSLHFFKNGFVPKSISEKRKLKELLDFKNSLNNKVSPIEYDTLLEFEYEFYKNVNLYLAQSFRTNNLLLTLNELQSQLEKQEKIKLELQTQLSSQLTNNHLKAKALDEINKGDYSAAEKHLLESASSSISDTASTFFELGKIKKLQLFYKEAFNYFDIAVRIKPLNYIYLYEAGVIAHQLGLYETAFEYYQRALKQIRKNTLGSPLTPELEKDLGELYFHRGDFSKARRRFAKSLTEFNKSGNQDYSFKAKIYNNIGEVYKKELEFDRAIQYYERAIAIDKKYYSDDHTDIAILYSNLGMAFYKTNNFSKAKELLNCALSIDQKFYGKVHPNIAVKYNNLGLINEGDKNYDEAIKFYKKSVSIEKKLYGKIHPNLGIRYRNIGSAYCHKKEVHLAIEYLKKALKILGSYLPEEHHEIRETQEKLNLAINLNCD